MAVKKDIVVSVCARGRDGAVTYNSTAFASPLVYVWQTTELQIISQLIRGCAWVLCLSMVGWGWEGDYFGSFRYS